MELGLKQECGYSLGPPTSARDPDDLVETAVWLVVGRFLASEMFEVSGVGNRGALRRR